jgi:hypothetical protein
MKWVITKPPTTKGGQINHSSVFMFSLLLGADPHTIHGLLQPRQIMMKCLSPCKHISLEFPSHIFIVGLSTRVGEQPNCDSTCFSGRDICFAIRLYNCNDSRFHMSDLHSWLSGQSVALC